jgi:3-dehydroquinate synthetase
MLLNYGHTVGHALEKLSDFTLPHGEAVAIGMVAENRVAVGKKILKENDASLIIDVIKMYNLPTKIPSKYSTDEIKKAIGADKKNIGGKLYFALPVNIGKAKVFPL